MMDFEMVSPAVLWLTLSPLLLYLLYKITTSTDIPPIPSLFEPPGALPMFGHLLTLGADHASTCERLWHTHRAPIFQLRLGNTRAVVVNSFAAARRILATAPYNAALIDRPTLYTFHGVISSTQGFTIGTSPWDESCRARRKAAGSALGRLAVRGYGGMFDLETFSLVRDLGKGGEKGVEVCVRPYIQRLALNTTLTLCYGIRMDDVYDDLLREILEVGSAISLLRSASENLQDYIPLLRYLPANAKNQRSRELRARRDKYLDFLLDKVRGRIERGTDSPCISAAILKDEETKLTGVEVSSICLSLVSGGFETIPGTLTSCLGSLATEAGQAMQERAYAEIMRCYPDVASAWEASVLEEKVPYVNAIVKEAARYYTVSAMSLPRKTICDVDWDGSTIPKGTMILINAQAANHDESHFGKDAKTFNPDRWLEPDPDSPGSLREKHITGPPHFGFGAGSRACSGQLVASRLLYACLVRLITSFKIRASETSPPNTDYVDYNQFKSALVAIPRDFNVTLEPRDAATLRECIQQGAERTRDLYVE